MAIEQETINKIYVLVAKINEKLGADVAGMADELRASGKHEEAAKADKIAAELGYNAIEQEQAYLHLFNDRLEQ